MDPDRPRAATEVLEVEDEERRHARMHELLSKVNDRPGPPRVPRPVDFDFGDRSTFPVAPPLHLLSRVQAFLPELAASNTELLRRAKEDPASVDIEHLDGAQAQYIEMNLGLGVFESRGPPPAHANIPVADVEMGDSPSSASPSSSSASSASSTASSTTDASSDSSPEYGADSDSDSDVDIVLAPAPARPRPTRPLPRRARGVASPPRPGIVVLSESTH